MLGAVLMEKAGAGVPLGLFLLFSRLFMQGTFSQYTCGRIQTAIYTSWKNEVVWRESRSAKPSKAI